VILLRNSHLWILFGFPATYYSHYNDISKISVGWGGGRVCAEFYFLKDPVTKY
jgi:hypothetical protein